MPKKIKHIHILIDEQTEEEIKSAIQLMKVKTSIELDTSKMIRILIDLGYDKLTQTY